MSERGSFVTEYIYCDRCFAAAWSVLGGHTKELMATRVPAWGETGTVGIGSAQSSVLPIVAGKIGSLRMDGEIIDMEYDHLPQLAANLCAGHGLRVAVLADSGRSRVFYVANPNIVRSLSFMEA